MVLAVPAFFLLARACERPGFGCAGLQLNDVVGEQFQRSRCFLNITSGRVGLFGPGRAFFGCAAFLVCLAGGYGTDWCGCCLRVRVRAGGSGAPGTAFLVPAWRIGPAG